MNTIKTLMVTGLVVLLQFAKSQTGEIRGLIKDDNLDPVIGALVKITSGGYLVGGTTTDAEGKYVYKPLDAGEYEIIVTSSMHSTCKKNRVPVKPNEATYVDIKMVVNSFDIVVIETDYEEPLVDATMIDIVSISREEWDQSAIRTEGALNAINTMYSGSVSDANGEWHLHGARSGATEYIVDGVRVNDMNGLPNGSIENISMISGGIPAMYGDLTSGVIIVTTRDYFSGMRAKRIRDREYAEKQEYKRKQRQEKLEEELRAKEIEQEKVEN